MSEADPIVWAVDLWKIYRQRAQAVEALRGVNLELREGEFVAILGPSGAGKSTLLHCLSGLEEPSRGEVRLKGIRLKDLGPSARARWINQEMGFVFQFYHLLGDLNALENLMLPARIRAREKPEAIRRRALELLDAMRLKDRASHFPSELSAGEQQRVAILRALMNDPGLLFCDEPTGNLDSRTGWEICRYLRGLAQSRNKTILIVTHDDKIAQSADRVLRLKDGQWEEEKERVFS